jgi:DNA-binding FadR family transcriptional regulator
VSFEKIDRKSVTQSVIESVQQYIVKNKLKAGDPLPSEHELSASLKVSRNILREALSHFKTLGIISTRPKTGLKIEKLLPDDPFRGYIPYIICDEKRLLEIRQMRLIIETGMIPLLIRNCKKEDYKKLSKLAGEMNCENIEKRVALDKEFHSMLLQITGNELLLSLQALTIKYFDYFIYSPKIERHNRSTAEIAKEHEDIASNIFSGNENALRKLFLNHYKW